MSSYEIAWTRAASEWAAFNYHVIVEAVKDEAPVRTGRGRASIKGRARSRLGMARIELTTDKPYMVMQVHGTRAHVIQAHGRVLHWVNSSGQSVYAMKVNHPGTKPNPYPTKGWEHVKARVTGDLERRSAQAAMQELRNSIQKNERIFKWL